MSIERSCKCFAPSLVTCCVLVSTCAGQVDLPVDLQSDSDAHPPIAVQRASLGSNLDMVFVQDPRFPVVTIHMYIPNRLRLSGRVGEISPEELVRHIFGNSLRASEGGEIGESLRALGASMSVSSNSSSDWIVIRSVCLRSHIRSVVRIMSELISPDGFQRKAIKRAIDELTQRQSLVDPMAQVRRVMREYLSLDDQTLPSNLSSASIPEHEEAIIRALIANLGRGKLPQGIVIAVSGRVDFDFLVRLFRNTFRSRIEHRKLDTPVHTESTRHKEWVNMSQCKLIEISDPSVSEVALGVGVSAVDPAHPDFPALVVLDRILGNGPGSRIYDRLRIEEGLSYRVFSEIEMFSTHSLFGIFAVFDNTVATSATTALLDEIGKLLDKGVTADELIDAQRALIGQEVLALESPEVQLHKLIVRGEVADLGQYWRSYLSAISSVSVNEVQRIARIYLAPNRLVSVASGNPSGVFRAKQSVRRSGLMHHTCFEGKELN